MEKRSGVISGLFNPGYPQWTCKVYTDMYYKNDFKIGSGFNQIVAFWSQEVLKMDIFVQPRILAVTYRKGYKNING